MIAPPPFRFLLPALLLVFGLGASWLDYRLNLANDKQRNFAEVSQQATATVQRLAAFCAQALAKNEIAAARDALASWRSEPWMRIAAVVDVNGMIIADSEGTFSGRPASQTPAAPAWKLARASDGASTQRVTERAEDVTVSSVVGIGSPPTAWVLVVFDRSDGLSKAYLDARKQLVLSGSVMALLCFGLWAVLHFGVATRLTRLAEMVKRVGNGELRVMEPLRGNDEVHDLSEAFSQMSQQLADRERERAALERMVIDSTEQERRRIGHELHDGIGQQLTALLMGTSALNEELQSAAQARCSEQAGRLITQLRDTITEVRALSHGLAPVPTWESGLEHALQSLAESTTRSTGVRCVFECPDPVEVTDDATAGNLYRVAQEAVNNALKHAAPSEIRIGLEMRDGTLVLEVDDDGEGMPEKPVKREGIGVRVMRHRAETMGSSFSIGAAPAGGTRVAVHLPMKSAGP